MEKATFAAGCFWGVEETFRQVKGVISTTVGYTGGHFPNPCYLDVCARITGHAESVQIEYDPSQITYNQLLEIFWNFDTPQPKGVGILHSQTQLALTGLLQPK